MNESFPRAHTYKTRAFIMSQEAEILLGVLVTTDSEAVRLRSGDLDALAVLMERYQHRLYRYLLRIVTQQSAAEDLFQQTWLRVMERIQKYDPQRGFEGWLFSVAHNLAIDYLRRRQPQSLDEPAFSGERHSELAKSRDAGALDWLLSREKTDLILRAITDLPPAFREVITLRFEEEMKLEEIADTLSVPMGTVKTRLHRALKVLKQSLKKLPEIRNAP
jgi:RNA polymerase sigma-70 factor, ECF subfamily